MEGVLVHPVCATITMTVETTVMNLDAVSFFEYSSEDRSSTNKHMLV